MGFKDFEKKVKDVKGRIEEDHSKAVEQSIIPLAEGTEDTVSDSR